MLRLPCLPPVFAPAHLCTFGFEVPSLLLRACAGGLEVLGIGLLRSGQPAAGTLCVGMTEWCMQRSLLC